MCEQNQAETLQKPFSPCCNCRNQLETCTPEHTDILSKWLFYTFSNCRFNIKFEYIKLPFLTYLGIQGEIIENHWTNECYLTCLKHRNDVENNIITYWNTWEYMTSLFGLTHRPASRDNTSITFKYMKL